MCKEDKYVIPMTFLRTKDPRPENAEYIVQYLEQIKLRDQYHIPYTCLMTYDAMRNSTITKLIKKDKNERTDISIWLELCREVVEKVNIQWRGLNDWEWTVEPGFLMAYKQQEKEQIIDCIMQEYFDLFGCYPKTVAAWLIDSYSMQYISEKYHPDAFVICREQWAMDAYTLWGGPYYGGYYPSKNNMLCPAQSRQMQINTPVFRMYVNDPIYCYYEHERLRFNDIDYHLFTQEPAWMCGQNPTWVNWHYDYMFHSSQLGFHYTQLGQENGFPWTDEMADALKMQYSLADQRKKTDGFQYITFSEMGRQFRKRYETTPETCVYALNDWAAKGNRSVWFNNERYRINVFSDKNRVWIRDLQLFDEDKRDVYLDEPCKDILGIYDNLPIVDGVQFSDKKTQGGLFFGNGRINCVNKNNGNTVIQLEVNGQIIEIYLQKQEIVIKTLKEKSITLDFSFCENCSQIDQISEDRITYRHRSGMKYFLYVKKGFISNRHIINSYDGQITLAF